MASYKYILFDLDGTISDPKIGITKSVAYALRYFGIDVENLDSLCKFIGPPLANSFMEYYDFDKDKADMAVSKYREYFSETGLYENTLYDGIESLLKRLKGDGKILILATSKPTVFAIKILEYFKLTEYFDFVSGSELDGSRVKKAEIIKYALEQTNISDLTRILMIGDREHDIIGANTIGISSVGVLYGFGDRNELEQVNATFIANTIADVGHIIGL